MVIQNCYDMENLAAVEDKCAVVVAVVVVVVAGVVVVVVVVVLAIVTLGKQIVVVLDL